MNKRPPRSASAERLYRARKQASKELHLPLTDWRVKRYAVLMVAYDGAQARAASGANIDVDNLLKLDNAMAEIRATVPVQRSLTLEFAGPVDTCPQCGWTRPSPAPEPPPTPPAPPTPTSDDTKPAAGASNVVPLKREVPGTVRSDGTIVPPPPNPNGTAQMSAVWKPNYYLYFGSG